MQLFARTRDPEAFDEAESPGGVRPCTRSLVDGSGPGMVSRDDGRGRGWSVAGAGLPVSPEWRRRRGVLISFARPSDLPRRRAVAAGRGLSASGDRVDKSLRSRDDYLTAAGGVRFRSR